MVAVRLVLRFAVGAPKPAGKGLTLAVAKLAHAAFYVLLIAMPVTGLLACYDVADLGDLHSWGKPVFIALIASTRWPRSITSSWLRTEHSPGDPGGGALRADDVR